MHPSTARHFTGVSLELARLAFFVTAAFGIGGSLQATHPEIVEENLDCKVEGNVVSLSWNIHFFAPIDGWLIHRDGELLAKLGADANSYVDREAPDGEHVYTLDVVNLDGTIANIGRCRAIAGDFGMTCRVDNFEVHLEWGPILIDVLILQFHVLRDGVRIGSTPPDELTFVDRVPAAGVYRYAVIAETSPGHGFVVGACTAPVRHTGFVCRVAPPVVGIDWSRVPLPEIVIDFFVIVRNDIVVGRTQEFSFIDEPGPGEHHYRVLGVAGGDVAIGDVFDVDPNRNDLIRIFVGECKIVMPGDRVPPPEELTCVDLDAPTDDRLTNVIDFVGPHDVLLVWQKPVEYDTVVITRNGERIASIDGSQFYYVDRDVPAGHYIYNVFGIVDDQISRPAECEVSIPRPPLPPPRDLVCTYVGALDPVTDSPVPDGFVQLRWTNGAAYDGIIIVRNGQRHARLGGDATAYRDQDPPAGLNVYAVFGVRGLHRSEKVSCDVLVPVGRVPPVENLRCAVIQPTPGPTPEPVPGPEPVPVEGDPNEVGGVVDGDPDILPFLAVALRWENPSHYDRLLIFRNNSQIATLPGDAESFIDHPTVVSDAITYCVVGVIHDRLSERVCCTVDIEPTPPPPPRDLRCDVVALTDAAGAIDPAVRGPVVRLTWLNPVRYGRIVVSRDDEILDTLPGDAMRYLDLAPPAGVHVYSVWGIGADGQESRRVRCEVEVPPTVVPPVRNLTCVARQSSAADLNAAVLKWENPVDNYDRVVIARNGDLLTTLPGNSEAFVDEGLEPGVYEYSVTAVRDDRRSAPRECRVVIDGPPPANVLYFSSGVFLPDGDNGDSVSRIDPLGRVTCMASNRDPLQGWSFGVCHDPSVLTLAEATIEATTTASLNNGDGPSFLSLQRHEGGATMAVIIDASDPTDTLPPASDHRLLRLAYAPGPDAIPGEHYRIRYCDTLGEPTVETLYVVGGFEVKPDRRPGFVELPGELPTFLLRGDVNGQDGVSMADAIYEFNWLFMGGPKPPCLEAADINGSGEINIADPIYELQWEFLGAPPPPSPFPECGPDPARLGCEEPTCPQPIP